MVRHYKRKSDRGRYPSENLQRCLTVVKNKEMSLRAASKEFRIPRAAIQKRLKSSDLPQPTNLGRFKRIFTDEMESQLKQRVLEMEGIFYGMSTCDLRRIAYDFAEANNVSHPFNQTQRMAGKDWVTDFIKRNHLAVRTPQSTSMNRVLAFDREKIARFFSLLKAVYETENIEPRHIYNLDESGVTTVPEPGKVLAIKGRKQVGRIASGEKGRTVTIVAAVSATGQFIPPAMIFPRQRMNDRLLHDALSGTVGYCSGNGWIDSTLFTQYLDHFIEHVRPTKEQKVLLVLDNHVSHKSLEAIEKARANGIMLLTLPPHTSSKLQPLDHTVFRALKVFYSQECDRWMINNMGKRITEYDIASILKPAFLKAMTPANIISGFRSTGTWPYNPNVISEADFNVVLSVKGISNDLNSVSQSQPSVSTGLTHLTATADSVYKTPSLIAAASSDAATIVVAPTAYTGSPQTTPIAGSVDEPSNSPEDTTTNIPTVSSPSHLKFIPLDVASPKPRTKHSGTARTQKRRAQQSEIITASPFKTLLVQKKIAKEASDVVHSRKNIARELIKDKKVK